jgi:hypothetical protein
VKEAVRLFRPVLKSLKIRSAPKHPIVFFAAFDELAHLCLNTCSIQVIVTEMDTQGMFLMRYTEQGSLRAFIFLNKMLYENPKRQMKELRKIAGVHEFVHFLARVYAITTTNTPELRKKIINELVSNLQYKVNKLPGSELLALYNRLINQFSGENVPEFTDAHFRLGYEGQTPNYDVLFQHLMFSRELYEEYFDNIHQSLFKDYMKRQEKDLAMILILDAMGRAAEDKDVPLSIAASQLIEWAHVYMRAST